MPLDIPAVQQALVHEGLDGWLLYDFQGNNPIATRVAGLASSGKLTTRRWYYFIPATGEPRGLVHAIERYNLDALPGEKRPYAGREQLASGLKALLDGARRVAMEYSPANAIPYVSRVDAGTVEAIRALGAEVVSSGDLIQRFEAVWTDAAYATHLAASEKLYRVKDRAFALIRERIRSGTPTTEFEVQQQMVEWFEQEGLTSNDPPNVSAQENAGNPHYNPTAEQSRAINPGELVLIDLWGKLPESGAIFADIAWVGFTGDRVPSHIADRLCRGPGRARCGHRAGRVSDQRRPGAARLRGRPGLPGGARPGGLRSRSSSIARATAWAGTSMATGSTWTTTRPTMIAG